MEQDHISSPIPAHVAEGMLTSHTGQLQDMAIRQSTLENSMESMHQVLSNMAAQLSALAIAQQNSSTVAQQSRAPTPVPTPIVATPNHSGKDPRTPDVEKFDGSPDKYLDFVVDLDRFFESQPNTYHLDKLKINYIFSASNTTYSIIINQHTKII